MFSLRLSSALRDEQLAVRALEAPVALDAARDQLGRERLVAVRAAGRLRVARGGIRGHALTVANPARDCRPARLVLSPRGARRVPPRGRRADRDVRPDLLRHGLDRVRPEQSPRRSRACKRADDRGHGLRRRAHLGRALQPGGHARVPRDEAYRAGARRLLLGRPARGRDPRRAGAAGALPERGESRHGRARRQPDDQPLPGSRARGTAHVLPRLGHLRDRGRPGRCVQDHRRARDRTDDHGRASSPQARSPGQR